MFPPAQLSSGSAERNSSPALMSVWAEIIRYLPPQMEKCVFRGEECTLFEKKVNFNGKKDGIIAILFLYQVVSDG